MESDKKVVWAEGILLSQQHFQQWDHALEMREHCKLTWLHKHAWGIYSYTLDSVALENAIFSLSEVSALFRDGRLIQMNHHNSDPLRLNLSNVQEKIISIYLAIADNQKVSGISGYPESSVIPAWDAEFHLSEDVYDQDRKREIIYARPRLHLMIDNDPKNEFVYMKIAEIKKENGTYQFNEFIPPVLVMNASSILKAVTENLFNLISGRHRQIQERLKRNKTTYESAHLYASMEIMMLSVLAQGQLTVNELLQQNSHPLQLYQVWLSLLGELSVFDFGFTLSSVPVYDHSNLCTMFKKLYQLTEDILNIKKETQTIVFQLARINESLRVIEQIENKWFNNSEFYIAVKYKHGDEWVKDFCKQVKITAPNLLGYTISSAMPGIKLLHQHHVPEAIHIEANHEYFYLEPDGECWQEAAEMCGFSIYVPKQFQEAEMQLIVMKQRDQR